MLPIGSWVPCMLVRPLNTLKSDVFLVFVASAPLRPVECQVGITNMTEQNICDPLDIASRIDWSFDCSRI